VIFIPGYCHKCNYTWYVQAVCPNCGEGEQLASGNSFNQRVFNELHERLLLLYKQMNLAGEEKVKPFVKEIESLLSDVTNLLTLVERQEHTQIQCKEEKIFGE